MSKIRKHILTIAGFDPTGGAGILADVKTFEQHKLLGFAIQTANTIQTADVFSSPNWIHPEIIAKQLDTVLSGNLFDVVKIGLIENLGLLDQLCTTLLNHNPKVKIIWDPILSSSSGYDFEHDLIHLDQILEKIYLITPNWEEASHLTGLQDAQQGAQKLARHCQVYLKGGHNTADLGRDYLYMDEKMYPFKPKGTRISPKHGSGCVFSSALSSNMLKGYPIIKACLRAKSYTSRLLESNDQLLGYHKF